MSVDSKDLGPIYIYRSVDTKDLYIYMSMVRTEQLAMPSMSRRSERWQQRTDHTKKQ